MYIKGFKIFQSDGHNHRKGVAILIATNLICDKCITFKDEKERFLKTKIKTPEGKETTIANIYTEPTKKEHKEVIPEEILNSVIIGRDLNKMNTSMIEDGVYQTFNAGKLLKRKNQPKGLSNHYILIYEKETEIKIDTYERIITYLNQEICQQSWKRIKEAITKDQHPKIQNPLMTKK